MSRIQRQFIQGRYGQVHVRYAPCQDSTRPPLVCLHMFPQSGRSFHRFVEQASQYRTVVAPDFPGYGESDRPNKPISAEDYAASIHNVIEALSLSQTTGQVDVFGIHAGAKLGAELARQCPRLIRQLVLSSAAVLTEEELNALQHAFSPIPLDIAGTRFERLWHLLLEHRAEGSTLAQLAEYFAEMVRPGDAYEWGHHAVFEFNRSFPEIVGALSQPITLINPKDDLYAMTPRTLTYLARGRLIDKPTWGHGYLDIHTEEVVALINNLLDDAPSPPDPMSASQPD